MSPFDENENSSLQKPMDRCRSPKLPLYTIFQLSSTRCLSNYFLTNKQTHTQQLNCAFNRERERERERERDKREREMIDRQQTNNHSILIFK